MKRLSILFCLLSLCLTGCASFESPPDLPYANNPFNINPYKPKKRPAMSSSDVARAANIGLNAASRPIAGAISPGAATGISSGLFVLNLLKNTKHYPGVKNSIGIKMPVTEANNIKDASKLVISKLTNAILTALPEGFTAKKVTYNDRIKDKPIEREWYLVDGPSCEKWSCQLIPLLNLRMNNKSEEEIHIDSKGEKYLLTYSKIISFSKITNDFIDEGKSYRYRVVEGIEIPNFDYPAFYIAISKQMPKWAFMTYLEDNKNFGAYQGKSLQYDHFVFPFEVR